MVLLNNPLAFGWRQCKTVEMLKPTFHRKTASKHLAPNLATKNKIYFHLLLPQ